MQEHVLPYAVYERNHNFRQEFLWREEVDMAFKAYKPALDEIHAKFSGRFEQGAFTPFYTLNWLL